MNGQIGCAARMIEGSEFFRLNQNIAPKAGAAANN
jgi:hypothetical protein